MLSEIARKYLGQTEKPGNMGFNDQAFEERMLAVGFQKKHAWCAYFVELCLKEAYPELFEQLDKLCSASVLMTLRNFQSIDRQLLTDPKVDTVVFWQSYINGRPSPKGTGHVGIVSFVEGDTFKSIEGNTSTAGSREGYIVGENPHRLNFDTQTGLRLLGFIEIA